METFTLRWSADRSLYFVEPSRGRNVRGFWLAAEKSEFPVPPEIIKNPYSGAVEFDGYWRRWFSMRGFVVQQSDPQTKVPGDTELVRDYLADQHFVTQVDEVLKVPHPFTTEVNTLKSQVEALSAQQQAAEQKSDAAQEQELVAETNRIEELRAATLAEPNPRPLSRAGRGARKKNDDEAAAGFSSGGRPPKHGRGKR